MECQPLSIELKERQENASFCFGVCPIPSFEVGYVAARRQVNHVVTRPSVILFHGRLDKGTTSEHRREIRRSRNMQLLEERNHEERIKSTHVSEDIDSDSQAKQKASPPGTKHTKFIYTSLGIICYLDRFSRSKVALIFCCLHRRITQLK